MAELNERDLETVAGGADGMDVMFVKSNCAGCPNDRSDPKCPYKNVLAAQARALGKVDTCPHKP